MSIVECTGTSYVTICVLASYLDATFLPFTLYSISATFLPVVLSSALGVVFSTYTAIYTVVCSPASFALSCTFTGA